MTHIHFSGTRCLALLACVSMASLLAACDTPNGGYYDANGNYVATDTPYNAKRAHAPMPGGNPDYRADRAAAYNDNHYNRRGYYDYNGYYMAKDSGLNVPADMFPPRGMCRVWFTDRALSDQPGIESCDDIRSRVPSGAYVIYGG